MKHRPVELSSPSLNAPVDASADASAAASAAPVSEPAPTPAALSQPEETVAFVQNETVPQNPSAAHAGQTLGRYEIRGVIGKGGMGEVYLAHDTVLLRTVALKMPRLADDSPEGRDHFLREARAAAALQHPHICPLHDVDTSDSQIFLTMAYIDGAPLSDVLRKHGPMDIDRAVELVRKVALAMHHAHERGLLHRDLKPGNILMTKNGEPAVTDFGLAFRFDADTGNRYAETGVVVGTPRYMPPEQINGQPLGPTADIYSLGVVMYELLAGKTPFEGTLTKLLAHIERSSPPSLCRLRADCDPALETICFKALAKAPGQRFADMAAFARALDKYAEEKKSRLLAEQATRTMRRRTRWLVGAGLLALGATVAAAVFMARRADRDIEPVPPMQLSDADRLFDALARPLVKLEWNVTDEAPVHIGRAGLPPSLLLVPVGDGNTRLHDGALYFSVSGSGTGHVLDLSDQPGQAGQVTHFSGDITVNAPYLLFLGSLTPSSRVFIKGGIGYSILAPMDGGAGCKHVEFDGTHLLMPKIRDPQIDTTQATGAERAALRNPDLIEKTVWSYDATQYVIYCRPGTKVVPGNHEVRKQQFPEVYDIIEADRRRQMNAVSINNARLQQALREAGRIE